MAVTKQPLQETLEQRPILQELCEHIRIGDKWYILGIQLNLDSKKLDDIQQLPGTSTFKTSKMFQLWLDTNPHATRKQVIDALKRKSVEQVTIAHEYENAIWSSGTEASIILECHFAEFSQCLINPVRVAQVLYSERCINEETLDKMETLEDTLDEKKTILLIALHTAISSDHKKLKALATVLSQFEEAKLLSERIISEYAQKFPNSQKRADNFKVITTTANQTSPEDHASDILRFHYGSLSQSLGHPLGVAKLLYVENVISAKTVSTMKSTIESLSGEKATFVLLKAIRQALHAKYHNLNIFISVLLKFTNNVPHAIAMWKDYVKVFPEEVIATVGEGNLVTTTSTMSPQITSSQGIPIPRTLSPVFGSVREEFALAFSKIREAINANPPPLDKLKLFLEDGYPYLQPQLAHSNSIDDILNVVREHCTLINISCLESIVKRFDIEEAKTHIKEYTDAIQSLCNETKASLCLGESFKVKNTPSLLQCETAVFVLDWNPSGCTLEDIKDILAKSVEGNVVIHDLRDGDSVIVTCFFPLSMTSLLIAKAQETLETVKEKGLKRLTIGLCTIYDKSKRDKEVTTIVEEELRSQLEIQQAMIETIEVQSTLSKNEKIDIKDELTDFSVRVRNQMYQLKEENSTLQQKLNEIADSNQEELCQLERQNVKLKDENIDLQDEIKNVKEKYKQVEQRLVQKDFQLKEMEKENLEEKERIQNELRILKTKNLELQTERNKALEERNDLKVQLAEKSLVWKEQFESVQNDFKFEKEAKERALMSLQMNNTTMDSTLTQKEIALVKQQEVHQYEMERINEELRMQRIKYKELEDESNQLIMNAIEEQNRLSKELQQYKKKEEETTSLQRDYHREISASQALQREVEQLRRKFQQNSQQPEATDFQLEQPHWVVSEEEVIITPEVLGKGSYGEVKVAVFRGLKVAAKSLHGLIISPYTENMFSREMEIASRVRHPNLVQFIGATSVGTPIILTELMTTSLCIVLQKKCLTQSQVIRISHDVATALNYLHLWKPFPIIHRDISSSNVLLEPSVGDSFKAKVTDYGAANLQQHTKTLMPGNISYAAIEALDPKSHTPAMDVYSYSILLIEMIIHKPPAATVPERERQASGVSWPPMLSLIQKCLNRDYHHRPTMAQILDTLKQLRV